MRQMRLSRRPLSRALAILPLAVSITVMSCGQNPGVPPYAELSDKPNLLVIVIDTLRADRIEAVRAGAEVMPRLKAFASGGRMFTHAVSPASWTRPAMASLFTGVYPEAHHVIFSADPAKPNEPTADSLSLQFETLAEFMQGAGYRTAGVQTNANLIESFGFAQGFDTYEYHTGVSAAFVTDRAIDLAAQARSPFFLYVHYMDPHLPHNPPPGYREKFGPAPVLSESDRDGLDRIIEYLYDYVNWKLGIDAAREFEELSDAAKEELRARYDAAVHYTDSELGRLLDHVQTNFPNTLIVVMSDHGEQFWEHDLMGHGLTLYQEEVLVPFIVAGPGIPAARVDTPVSTINLLPTLAAYLDLPVNSQWQASTNLLENPEVEPVFSRTQGPYPSLGVNAMSAEAYPHKLIKSESSPDQLFEIAADPNERTPLSLDAEPHRELSGILDAHMDLTRKHGEQFPPPPKAELDQWMIDILGGLGYGESDTETVEE